MGGFTKIPKFQTDLGTEGTGDRIALYDEFGRLVGWKPNTDSGGTINNSYSTTEALTGGTWIDGKPIYRIVILHDLSNEGSIFIEPLNIKKICKADVKLNREPLGFDISQLPFSDNSIDANGRFVSYNLSVNFTYDDYAQILIFNEKSVKNLDGTEFSTESWRTSGNLEVIMEYTKTTD